MIPTRQKVFNLLLLLLLIVGSASFSQAMRPDVLAQALAENANDLASAEERAPVDADDKRRLFIGKRIASDDSGEYGTLDLASDPDTIQSLEDLANLYSNRHVYQGKKSLADLLEEETHLVNDMSDKRNRWFVGKREWPKRQLFIGKRSYVPPYGPYSKRRLFIGKRDDLDEDEKRRLFIGKRDDFEDGKRRLWIGRRADDSDDEKRRLFIGKKDAEEPTDKRVRFIGKRSA